MPVLGAAAEAQQEREDGAYQKHDEEDFRDAGGTGCDPAEPEYGGDQRDDKKDDGIMKHDRTWCYGRSSSACGRQYRLWRAAAQSVGSDTPCRTRLTWKPC